VLTAILVSFSYVLVRNINHLLFIETDGFSTTSTSAYSIPTQYLLNTYSIPTQYLLNTYSPVDVREHLAEKSEKTL